MGHVKAYFGEISLCDTVWDDARPLLPRQCVFTGKWILPFTKARRNRRIGYDGKPGTIFFLEYCAYWSTSNEFLIQKLKGNV